MRRRGETGEGQAQGRAARASARLQSRMAMLINNPYIVPKRLLVFIHPVHSPSASSSPPIFPLELEPSLNMVQAPCQIVKKKKTSFWGWELLPRRARVYPSTCHDFWRANRIPFSHPRSGCEFPTTAEFDIFLIHCRPFF